MILVERAAKMRYLHENSWPGLGATDVVDAIDAYGPCPEDSISSGATGVANYCQYDLPVVVGNEQVGFEPGSQGLAGLGSWYDPFVDVITSKARAGAEEAIPEIQTQVKIAIQPYVVASLVLGLIGTVLSLAAYMKVRKYTRRAS